MSQAILAIDPGVSGGIAFLDEEGNAWVRNMPETDGDFCDFILELKASSKGSIICYLEKVGGFMAQRDKDGKQKNVAAAHNMFTFGNNFGFMRGVLHAMTVPVEMVLPAHWQSTLSIPKKVKGMGNTPWKNLLKEEAQRRYPELKVTLNTADALLILSYGKIDQRRERLV